MNSETWLNFVDMVQSPIFLQFELAHSAVQLFLPVQKIWSQKVLNNSIMT